MSASPPSLGDPLGRGLAPEKRPGVIIKVAFHSVILFVLPFVVGGLTAVFAEVSQVSETARALFRLTAAVLMPILVVQCMAVALKVSREKKAMLADGPLPPGAVLLSVYRHVKVMTDKGMGMFFGGLFGVVLALLFKFAELGVMAVLGLTTLYLAVAAGTILSTFVVARFEERLATRGGTIGRQFAPVVIEAGDSVEEHFHFERVPIPAGFNLKVHQELPARLATESRHVVGPAASQQRVTLTRPLRRTPRGDYRIAPASIAYSDFFGLVNVAVAQAAGARLKVLPRMCPVALEESPRVLAPEEGVLSVLRKLPTDDYFRFRDYIPGDDTRRIHWKLSVKLGRLQVRLPETVPVVRRRVRLVLDNHIPPYILAGDESDLVLGDALDRLVDVWLSLARALTERGEDVSLVLPTGESDKPFEELHCTRGTQARWRELGARAKWQRLTDLHHSGQGLEKEQFMVVVTARFSTLPPLPPPMGGTLTWVFLPLGNELPGPVPGTDLTGGMGYSTTVIQPFPAGSEENSLFAMIRRTTARRRLEVIREGLVDQASRGSTAAEGAIRARGEPFYRVRRSGPAYLLQAQGR